MISNATTIHNSLNEVDVSNYRQPAHRKIFNNEKNSYHIVGYKSTRHEKCKNFFQTRKSTT